MSLCSFELPLTYIADHNLVLIHHLFLQGIYSIFFIECIILRENISTKSLVETINLLNSHSVLNFKKRIFSFFPLPFFCLSYTKNMLLDKSLFYHLLHLPPVYWFKLLTVSCSRAVGFEEMKLKM